MIDKKQISDFVGEQQLGINTRRVISFANYGSAHIFANKLLEQGIAFDAVITTEAHRRPDNKGKECISWENKRLSFDYYHAYLDHDFNVRQAKKLTKLIKEYKDFIVNLY